MCIKSKLVSAFLLGGLSAPTALAQLTVEVDSLTYSESASVETLFDGLEGGSLKGGGDRSFTHNEVRAEYAHHWGRHQVSVGAFWRYDYVTDYSPDAVKLIHASTNGLPIEDGVYDLSLHLNHAQSRGLSLGYRYTWSDELTFGLRVNGFKTDDLTYGDTYGLMNLGDQYDNGVEGQLVVDYYYTNDLFFDRDVPEPDGLGVSLDVFARWQARPNWLLTLEIDDLVSRVDWDDAPHTYMDISTATVETLPSGLFQVRPVLQGQHSFREFDQRFPIRTRLEGVYTFDDQWDIVGEIYWLNDFVLAEIEGRYKISDDAYVGLNYEVQSQGLGFEARYKGLFARVSADKLDYSEAKYLKFNFGVSVPF